MQGVERAEWCEKRLRCPIQDRLAECNEFKRVENSVRFEDKISHLLVSDSAPQSIAVDCA
jgi:hypothetical protein